MRAITVNELTAAVEGTLLCGDGAQRVDTFSTDSRTVGTGEVFVPIVGERFDGHDYMEKAMEAGAAGCLCARAPEHVPAGKFCVLTDDTRLALKRLATWYRAQFDLPVVQITGSVGKTTTKEMVASVLSQRHRTVRTDANFNSDLGVPQTLFRIDDTTEAAVVETGMDHFGEIRYLGEMVRPHIALITNIGDMHIEFLGSRQGILKAKSEIFENLDPDGVAILNGDDELLNTVSVPQRIVRCGKSEGCGVRVSDVRDHGVEGVECTVTTARSRYELRIPAPGVHMIYAASMALAVGEELGLSPEEITRGVASYEPSGARMRVEKLAGGRIVLNDSYNAGPQSMAAALRTLAATDAVRRIAMLGDMKELGGRTESGHREIGELVGALGIDTLLCVGEACRDYMAPAAKAAGCADVRWYAKKEDAYGDLTGALCEGAAVLLKASHFSGRFDLIADYLREYPF